MRLNKLFLLGFFVLPSLSFAQNRWDVGVKVGAADGLCDIGGISRSGSPWIINMQPTQIRWDLGGYVRYKISPAFSVAGNFDYVRLQGFDSLSKVTVIRDRNLNYSDDIFEGSVRAEWTFYEVTDIGGYYNYKSSFNAYLFIGAGIFHMNPEAMFTHSYLGYRPGDYYPLANIETEGETPYAQIQASIPMGIGFYYTINRSIKLGWEFGWTKTFTDYIDDVSGKYPSSSAADVNLPNPYNKYFSNQSMFVPGITPQELNQYSPGSPRGNPKNDDSWISTAITFGVVIHSKASRQTRQNMFEKYRSRASF
jgi:hypothetical protein